MQALARATKQRWAAVALALALAVTAAKAQVTPTLFVRSPTGNEVRALIIGIDAYQHYRPLKGAVADARDIENALLRMGTKDVTTLIDAQADRARVLRELDALIARTQPNDLVFLTIAGHGAQEPERVKGSEPDGFDNVFLLAAFQPTPEGSLQRILGKEFNHFIKRLELRGARVVFIADTCHGGGMAREIDPRAEEMSFRQIPSYRLTSDVLQPVTTTADNQLTELDFDHTEFLAAVDRRTKAPEVSIPGVSGLRGALSYSIARAIEGNADANGDGRVTVKELFTNVRQNVYQLSNQRQNIVTLTSPARDLDKDVVFALTRSVNPAVSTTVASPAPAPQPTAAPQPAPSTAQPTATPSPAVRPTAAPAAPTPAPSLIPVAPTKVAPVERPVRIAALDSNTTHFAGLKLPATSIEIVRPLENPDIVFDPASRDVIASGDVVAYKIDKDDLPGIIDRTAAIRLLKQTATNAIQVIKLTPDDSLHRNRSEVQIEVSDVAGRALVLFNIAGDGTVQMLYPVGKDQPILPSATFRFPVRVQEPFGADQIVAVTSAQRMTELEQVLNQLNRRRAATQVIKMVQRYAPRDARIGSTGLFTAP